MSPQGLLDFFHVLETQNLRISADGSEYLRTHPLTRDRITFLEQQVAQSPYRDAKPDPALSAAYDRVVAKLDGFLVESGAGDRPRAKRQRARPLRPGRSPTTGSRTCPRRWRWSTG